MVETAYHRTYPSSAKTRCMSDHIEVEVRRLKLYRRRISLGTGASVEGEAFLAIPMGLGMIVWENR